jgi:hypothetical protein
MNNLAIIPTELWFINIDSLMIITTSLTLIFGLIFLIIAITHRICWTVSMMLVCNSCLAEVLLSCILLSITIFTFHCDLKQNTGNTTFCVTFDFLCYIVDTLQNYSYLLTAIYRYVSVVHPSKLFWKSAKFQIGLIIGQCIFSTAFALPLLLTGQIVYNIDNQICQVPLRLSVSIMYVSFVLYFIPNISILCIYIKLARYVRQMSIRTTSAHSLFHARRELRLFQRTFILVIILIILGIPYAIVVFISLFTTPPKYHFRIAYIFVDISLSSIMIVTYYFTEQVTTIIQKIFIRSNAIEPIGNTART